MIETFVLVFVAGNFFLQLGWFIWSYNIHNRKHFADDPEIEIDLYDRLKSYIDEEFKKRDDHEEAKVWSDWVSEGSPKVSKDFDPRPVEPVIPDIMPSDDIKTNTSPLRDEDGNLVLKGERKYNPDTIPGAFDSLFTKDTK